MLHACVLSVDVRIPAARSLKEKRTVVKHLVDACRSRFGVAAAEVGFQDQWQRAELGFAAVSGEQRQVEALLDSVERYVWSHPQLEVLDATRAWIESDG